MPLSLNTNSAALFSQATLNTINQVTTSNVARLSSGLRVNSARDDAAGLAIASRLTSVVDSSDDVLRSLRDGTSFMEVADGAAASITNNLQRMRELATQASTSTIGDAERRSLDLEYQQLAEENQRIIKTTEFNGVRVFSDDGARLKVNSGTGANDSVAYDLRSFVDVNGNKVSGSLESIFGQNFVTKSSVQTINYSGAQPNATTVNGPATAGTYNVNVNQLAENYTYNISGVGGAFGANGVAGGVTTTGNPAVADYVSGPAGSYTVEYVRGPQGYQYANNTAAATGGVAAQPAATNNSNPAVATANGTPAVGTYNVVVNQTAQSQISQVNVGAGNPTFGQADTSGLPGQQGTRNDFTVDFANNALDFNFSVNPDGEFTVNDYVNAFNAASGGAVTASYNNATGVLTYTGNVAGNGGQFTVTNDSTNFIGTQNNVSDPFQANNGDRIQVAQNATGTVNGTAFNDADGNNITVGGLNFNALSVGNTTITRTAAVAASNNTFRINFGDGTAPAVFNVNGGGAFTKADFVNAFNTAAAGKFTASIDGSGNIQYVGNENGAEESFTLDYLGNNAPDSSFANRTQTQAGNDFVFTVNGGPEIDDQDGVNVSNGTVVFNKGANNTPGETVTFTVVGGAAPTSNQYRLDFGDGTPSQTFTLVGQFTAADYVSAFNTAAGGKFTASADGAGNISIVGNEDGVAESLSIVAVGGAIGAFAAENQTQAGQDFDVDINGTNFTGTGSQVSNGDITLDLVSTGSQVITVSDGEESTYGDIASVEEARSRTALLDSFLDGISRFRGVVGANIAKLEASADNVQSLFINLSNARSKILDLDFAKEIAALTKNNILAQSGISVLNRARESNQFLLGLLG